MQFIGILIQVALLVAWYVVPAMATVPAWVIFLPLLVSGICLAFVLLFLAITLGITLIAGDRN
jgi:hypothetical protein